MSTVIYNFIFRKKVGKKKNAAKSHDEESTSTLVENTTPTTSSTLYSDLDDKKDVKTLPPPNSSFFADKMELDSTAATDIYLSYVNASSNKEDLDNNSKPLFLSNAAVHIQQKAATLRSTLRQSLRMKKKPTAKQISQLFDQPTLPTIPSANYIKPTNTDKMARSISRHSASSSTSISKIFPRSPLQNAATHNDLPPSPRLETSVAIDHLIHSSSSKANSNNNTNTINNNKYYTVSSSKNPTVRPKESNDSSNKIMIDTAHNDDSYYSLPMTPTSPTPIGIKTNSKPTQKVNDYSNVIDEINQYSNNYEDESDEEIEAADADVTSSQEAATMARKLIRTASRKSRKKRAPVSNDLFKGDEENEMPSTPISTYATIRINNKQLYNNAIEPLPVKSTSDKILSGSATVSGRRSVRAQNQLHDMFSASSDNVLLNTSNKLDGTIGRKKFNQMVNNNSKEPKSLMDLFSQPSSNTNRPVSNTITINDDKNKSTTNAPITPNKPALKESIPFENKPKKVGNNVDTIRKMLQSSWSNSNIKDENELSPVGTTKSNRRISGGYVGSMRSPVGSINPRLQNQHLVSLSLKANNVVRRPAIPMGFIMNEDENGPEPTISFSSSTVRTMIPEDEAEGDNQSKSQEKHTGYQQSTTTIAGKTPAQIEREKYLKSIVP